MAQTNAVVPIRGEASPISDEAIWKLVATGDLTGLTDAQKTTYYLHLCESLGLNPATAPFEYLRLNNKLVLYAKRGATDQLREIHGVSMVGKPDITDDGEYITAEVTVQDAGGRTDYEIGVVAAGTLRGEARANLKMKALTKAKRRATLSICGLGMLDETEVETIPGARVVPFAAPEQQASGQPQQTTARPSGTAGAAGYEVAARTTASIRGALDYDEEHAIRQRTREIAGHAETVDPETGEILEAESRVIDHDPADLGLVTWLIRKCDTLGIKGDDWQRRWWHGEYGLQEVDGHLSRKTLTVAHAEALKSMLLQDPHRAKTMASPYRAEPAAAPAEPTAEPDDREARLIYLRELMIGGSWPELVTEAGDDEAAWVAMALAVEDLSQHSRLVAEAKRAGKLTALVSAAASDRAKQIAARP